MHLIINSYGTSLRIDNRRIAVKNDDTESYFALHEISGIHLSKGVLVTSDLLLEALQHDIDILLCNKKGDPLGRLSNNRFGSVSTIRANQSIFITTVKAAELIQAILSEKMLQQQIMIETLALLNSTCSGYTAKPVRQIQISLTKLQQIYIHDAQLAMRHMRVYEAQASRVYFGFLKRILPESYAFKKRVMPKATDPFNAMLNYLYGILYAMVERSLIKAGLDPYLGIMHRNDYNKPSLVFDIIERYRHWAEYVLLHLIFQNILTLQKTTTDEAYTLDHDTKHIIARAMFDYLDEVVELNNLERSRQTHMELYARNLAQNLKTID